MKKSIKRRLIERQKECMSLEERRRAAINTRAHSQIVRVQRIVQSAYLREVEEAIKELGYEETQYILDEVTESR